MKLWCSKCKTNERLSYRSYCGDCWKVYTKTPKAKAYRKSYDKAYSKTYKREPYSYKITNIEDGTVYYGHTTTHNRWATHKNKAFNEKATAYTSPFYQAIRSLCKDKSEVETHFKFEILGYTSTKAEARALELHLIKKARERGQAVYNSPKATS